MQIEKQSPYINSYDVLKTLALILMVVDHVGFYFFPHEEWFRVIGRLSAPIWFFLVGYARSRDVSFDMWLGALGVFSLPFLFGGEVLPLNIFFSIILTRFLIDRVAPRIFKNAEAMIIGIIMLSILYIPTLFIYEYGAAGFALALFGYASRNRDDLKLGYKFFIISASVSIFYFLSQVLVFNMTQIQYCTMAIGIALIFAILYHFKPALYPNMPLSTLFKLGGRHSFSFYILHLILFKCIACALGLGAYGWFAWSLGG